MTDKMRQRRFKIMVHLTEARPAVPTYKELARVMGVNKMTIVHDIEWLEANGYVERDASVRPGLRVLIPMMCI